MSMGPLKFEFKRPALSVSGEIGSLAELVGALQDEGNTLVKMFGSDMELLVTGLGTTEAATTTAIGAETAEAKTRRTRGPNKAKEMTPPTAPPPIPVAPVDMTPNANGIPAGLVRDPATNTAPIIAPPTPPAPPSPPVPPTGVLAEKIIPHMEDIASKSPDGGKAWVDWLARDDVGIVVKGATFAEAMKCLRMLADDKLKPVADALGIAA